MEPPVIDGFKQVQSKPGAGKAAGDHGQNKEQPLRKHKTGHAEYQGLGGVLQGHGGAKGGDGAEAVGVNLLDKRRHQGAGSAHEQTHETGDGRSDKHAERAKRGLGQPGAPAQVKHEQGNAQLPQMSRQIDQQPGTQSGPCQHAWGEGGDHLPVDMMPGQYGPATVGTELNHAVNRNDRRRWQPGCHQYQQQDTAAGAQGGGYHGGNR